MWGPSTARSKTTATESPHRRSCGHGNPYHASKHVDRGWISPWLFIVPPEALVFKSCKVFTVIKFRRNFVLAPVGRVYYQTVWRVGQLSRHRLLNTEKSGLVHFTASTATLVSNQPAIQWNGCSFHGIKTLQSRSFEVKNVLSCIFTSLFLVSMCFSMSNKEH